LGCLAKAWRFVEGLLGGKGDEQGTVWLSAELIRIVPSGNRGVNWTVLRPEAYRGSWATSTGPGWVFD